MQWPIFAISLKDAHDRRETLLDQCDALGLTVEIIDAVDGRQGLPPKFEHKIDREGARSYMDREMTDGEFACALSHQSIYERIIRDGLPGAIVLEDDALLTEDFAYFVKNQGYLLADFIQMDYMHARYRPWKKKRYFDHIKLVQLVENAGLTTAYSLSRFSTEYILSRSSPLRAAADWPCDVTPLQPLVTVPRLVTQPPASENHSAIEIERAPLIAERRRRNRWKRFGRMKYWKRWLSKKATRTIR